MAHNVRSRVDMGGRMVWYSNGTGLSTIRAFADQYFDSDFISKALDTTFDWNVSVEAGAIAVTGGFARSTPAAADNDTSELATGLNYLGSRAPCAEARIRVNDVDKSAVFFGFTDDITEGAGLLPVSYNGAAITKTANDCIGLLWDADSAAGYIRMMATKATATAKDTATTVALTDGLWAVYRVETDALGNARFFINGTQVGSGLLLVTLTAPLCVLFGHSQRSNDAADTVDVDYVRAWQNRTA